MKVIVSKWKHIVVKNSRYMVVFVLLPFLAQCRFLHHDEHLHQEHGWSGPAKDRLIVRKEVGQPKDKGFMTLRR